MSTATVTSKGQVTIPKDVREDLGLSAGDRLIFVRARHGGYSLYAKNGSVMDLPGIFKYDGPPLSAEEIDEAVGSALVAEDARTKSDYVEPETKHGA